MMITLLRAKLHGARITGTDLEYEGSILIDAELLELAGILPFEKVSVWNRTNGNRFDTYAISAPPGSKTIMVNGAAAHLVRPEDIVIIAAFTQLTPEEARSFRPRVVLVDEKNQGRIREDKS